MSYIKKQLGPREELIAVAKAHWINLFSPLWLFLLSIVLIFVNGIGVFFIVPILVLGFIYVKTTDLGVSNKKVIAKWGLISRRTIEQRLSKIDAIQVNQGVLGRLLNYGDIIVIGSGLAETPIKRVADPMKFRKQVELAEDSEGKLSE